MTLLGTRLLPRKIGGGCTFVMDTVLPRLRRRRADKELIDTLTRHNPTELRTFD